jgi:hypothetical protein
MPRNRRCQELYAAQNLCKEAYRLSVQAAVPLRRVLGPELLPRAECMQRKTQRKT